MKSTPALLAALVAALHHAGELGLTHLHVHSDSELLVKQMNGEYKVKNADLESVNGAIKRRIKPENLAIVMVGTASQILEAAQKAIPNLASTDVIPFDKI